jgi:hypothetical protein
MSDTERRLADIEKRLDESSAYALMVACARMQRRLEDIEKRLARVERMLEKPAIAYDKVLPSEFAPYCPCGRDVCRAPDCPSHKPDPLGR